MESNDTLHWGILGTGMIARRFASQLPESHRGRLAGAASRSPETAEAFAAEFGGRGFAGYESLLDSPDIDAVYVALPNHLHREWTEKALDAGKHVLCEKPLAIGVNEAESMFERARATGRVLVEAFMYRAHPQTRLLLDTIRNGEIGEVRLIRANFTFSRPASREDARYVPGPGGGSLMDVGCYCVDFTRSVVGAEPMRTHAVCHRHEFGVDDYAAGTLAFPGGELATFTCGMTVASDQTAHIAGAKGRIEIPRFWQAREGFTLVRPDEEARRLGVEEERPLLAVEADAFAEVVGGGENWNSPENTLGNLHALEALREQF